MRILPIDRKTWKKIVLVILLAGTLAIIRNGFFSDGLNFQHEIVQSSGPIESVEISLKQGYRLFQQDVQFIDARTVQSYNESHISGAISLPANASFQEKMMKVNSLDEAKTYVIYCNDPECALGDEIYELLQVGGFQSVHIMYEGFDGWEQAGYPVAAVGRDSQ